MVAESLKIIFLVTIVYCICHVTPCSDDTVIPLSNVNDYVGKGVVVDIPSTDSRSLRAYVVGSGADQSCSPQNSGKCNVATQAIIVFYDVFGFDVENTRHFCDLLAKETGFLVIMPDFFDGKAWPRPEFKSMATWLQTAVPWKVISNDLKNVMSFLTQQYGITGKLGVLGFCWGGQQALKACSLSEFGACASIHGAWLTTDDAENASSPMLFVTPDGDPDISPIRDVFDDKPFGSKCQYYKAQGVSHGFAGNGGDWSIETVRKRVEETIELSCTFFSTNLKS